jgi:hypothetical protein
MCHVSCVKLAIRTYEDVMWEAMDTHFYPAVAFWTEE